MLEIIILILSTILLIHYSIFLFSIYSGLNNLKSNEARDIDEFISIIIPFRNEAENILNSLKSIEAQSYPQNKFEVIYVNDNSTDNSEEILKSAITKKNIKSVKTVSGNLLSGQKKNAIKYGIGLSKGDIIVTTDADCIHQNNWLKSLLSYFETDTGFVSGPVDFIDDGKLFSKLQRLEFAGLIITGAGLIGNETPAICNAANLTYRKKAYHQVNGFEDNLNLSSGDDEILMQKIHSDTNYKIKVCLNKNAMVSTNPNKIFSQFFEQRKRWASKGLFYKNKILILKLILIFFFYLGIIVQLFLGLITSSIFLIGFIISFSIKLVLEYLILQKGIKLLYTREILKPFLLAELLHIPYIIISSVSGLFGNYNWKGRNIKR